MTQPLLAKILVVMVSLGLVLAVVRLRSAPAGAPHKSLISTTSAVRASSTTRFAAPTTASVRALAVTPDTSEWFVPAYADDPVKGPSDALVTIVEFSEFESPFCKQVAQTLDQLLREYPTELRVVWKDNPVAFHARGRLAATLARRAYVERGPTAFWQAHDLLCESQPKLDDAALQSLAQKAGLAWDGPGSSPASQRASDKIDQSIELGGDVGVRGIPHFFINGRRLAGAQRIELFRERIDAALEQAARLVAQGVPKERIYDEIIKNGRELPAPEHRDVPAPDTASPFRGTAGAPIALQLFAEFPCRSCERVLRTLGEIEAEYRGKVRTVFRYLPPSPPAQASFAEAAQEAFARGGPDAFWLFQERVLEALDRDGSVDGGALEKTATTVGVDARRVHDALASGKHRPRLASDAAAAKTAGIETGPGVVVDGYVLGSEPSFARLKKFVRRALR
jgi:protein-disulfide isomerase